MPSFGPPSPSKLFPTSSSKTDKMKYFKVRRRRLGRPNMMTTLSDAIANTLMTESTGTNIDKVGADYYSTTEQSNVDLTEQTNEQSQSTQQSSQTEKGKRLSKDSLSFARQRKDIRLTRTEVSCLQLLVQSVLNEHLVLSRELQAANERMGLPVEHFKTGDKISPLARNVERLQSALERDACRLRAALRDREERLENVTADAAAVKTELEKWRHECSKELESQRLALQIALAERDKAYEVSEEKDQVISNLRSKLAKLELKKSNEALTMSRALTEKEIIIEKLNSQIRDHSAELVMSQEEYGEIESLLEMERTARHSTDNDLESVRSDLKKAREDSERAVLMLNVVLSDKEEELEDMRRQMEEAKLEFEEDFAEIKRAAEVSVAEVKHSLEKAVTQKTIELHDVQSNLKRTQTEVQRLRSELEKEKNKVAVVHGELAVTRNELAYTRETASASSQQVSRVEAQLAEERIHHEEEMRERVAAFEERMKSYRTEAESVQSGLENRMTQLKDEALAEKINLEKKVVALERKLRNAENVASRLPTLEANIRDQDKEIGFLREKATERNAELATKKKEAQQNLEEANKRKEEMELMRKGLEEEMAKLREELAAEKGRRDEEASQFRKALHERDLEIRERQDRIDQMESEQEKIQKSVCSLKKILDDTTQKHKSSMASAKSAYRETISQFKKQVSEKGEEVRALQDTVKALHTKITELHRQHNQELDKLKSSWEKTRNSLEKKILEKDASLKECEMKRANISSDLSKAVESRDMILKELELVRDELKRTVDVLFEAKAETRLALDTMAESERAMASIYEDSVQKKMKLNETQLKIDEIERKWIEAAKDAQERQKNYTRLKIRFFKFVKFQDDELRAAGDSAEQNRAEAQRCLEELQSSRTALLRTEDRCRSLKSELELARQKIESMSGNENALLTQTEQNKQLLALAEGELQRLKNVLGSQSSELIHIKKDLAEKESQLEILFADLSRERALSAKHSAEFQDACALIESVSRERGLMLNANVEVKLPDGVEMLLQNIRLLETKLQESYQELDLFKQENEALKQELASKTLELKEQQLLLASKDECADKLQADLADLLKEISAQQAKITDLEKYTEEILHEAKAALEAQETLKGQLQEGKSFINDANSKIERLTRQIEHERSHVAELQNELSKAMEIRNVYQQELNVKSLSIQDLSASLCHLEEELHSKDVLWKTLEERTDEAENLKKRLNEQEREVSRLLSLLENAHLECDCKAHYESADGDGRKETHSEGLKELKTSLAERDTDVAKLRSVIVDLQGELSVNQSTSDEQIALYRFQVEELSNEITALRRQLEEQESDMRNSSEQAKLDLHWTAEQTRLNSQHDPSRVSPRRRPGAPGGAPPKRTLSEGTGESETDHDGTPVLQIPEWERDSTQVRHIPDNDSSD